MQTGKNRRRGRLNLVELGIASTRTLGLPLGEIIEPMGFWHKPGISDQ